MRGRGERLRTVGGSSNSRHCSSERIADAAIRHVVDPSPRGIAPGHLGMEFDLPLSPAQGRHLPRHPGK
eukprot:3637910-Pyramimonas_sp.AAC.1